MASASIAPSFPKTMEEISVFHASVLKALDRFAKKADAYGYRMNDGPGFLA